MKTYKTEMIGLFSSVALLSLLAFASSAHAERGPKHGADFGGPGFAVERMAERYGLDETQRQQIENIIAAAQPEFQALRERMQSEVEAVLTEEQLAEFEADKERMKERANRAIDGRRGQRQSDPQ